MARVRALAAMRRREVVTVNMIEERRGGVGERDRE